MLARSRSTLTVVGWSAGRRLVAVAAASLMISPLLVGWERPAEAATPTAALAFDRASTSTLRNSPRKVYAHYVSWMPVSLDNKPASEDYYTRNYMSPHGEGGRYRAYGGKQRDRPMPRPVRGGDWRLQDMQAEVRTAIGAGMDGFVVSMVQTEGQWAENTKLLLRAAQSVDPGFKIVLRPNMISFDDMSAGTLARHIAALGRYPAARRVDGKLLVSPYLADRWSVDKWKQFNSIMSGTYGTPVALWPVFHNERTWDDKFSPISYGLSNWGDRNPAWNDPVPTGADSRIGRVNAVQARGDKWMQPVSLQDARPTQSIFDESQNTTNLRNTWQIAIASGSDAVHIPTWNDYVEGTAIAPTPKHGHAFLDINAYYLQWYKTGTRPSIVRDRVYLSHRTQPVRARPSFSQSRLMSVRGGSTPRDTVEALTFLKAPARVTVQVGSKAYVCQVAAGVDTCTVPLGAGKVSVKVVRSGTLVAATTGTRSITSAPYVQDLDNVAVSSGRQPTGGSNGTAVTSTTKIAKTIVVTASADAYANAGAPSTNYGGSSSLSSRGAVGAASYLRFTVPPKPAGMSLSKAALRLHTGSSSISGSANTHPIHIAGNSWSESTLTWRNRPGLSTRVGALRSGTVPGRVYDSELSTGAAAGMLGTTRALALTSGGSDELRVWSRNFSHYTMRPQLVLTFLPS